MTFETRLKTALAILARTGIRRMWYAPPTHRLLWRLGVKVRPPHFSGKLANLLFGWLALTPPTAVLYFAVSSRSPATIIVDSAQLGFYLALTVMGFYAKSADDHDLPAWSLVESADQPPHKPSTHWLRDG